MARTRQTVNVKAIIEKVNQFNATSKVSADIRHGQNVLAETILHAANAYAGFGYLTAANVPAGELPGIIYGDRAGNGSDNQYPDESRIFFYTSKL